MEWACKLSKDDINILGGKTPYSEKAPNVDEGFTQADLKDEMRSEAIYKVIRARLAKSQKDRPIGYLVRETPSSRRSTVCRNSSWRLERTACALTAP